MRLLFGLFLAFAGCCAIVACSGSMGGGTSSLPGGQLPPLQNPSTTAPQVTASPSIASGDIVIGDGSVQTLPAVGDFKVTAVFPKSTSSPVTLKVTVSTTGPGDIGAYGEDSIAKKKLFGKHHTQSPAVLYVWFENDKGVLIAAPPALAFTVPLTALDPFGTDPTVDLALYDPAVENKWMQRIASQVETTPTPAASGSAGASSPQTPTASPTPSPTPTPTATPTPSPSPSASGTPRPPGASPTATVTAGASATVRPPVPTQVFRFAPSGRAMNLLPRKNFVFVLYAQPIATPASSASGAAKGKARGSAAPSPSGSASASSAPTSESSSSASPASSASAGASPSTAPSPQPSKS